MALNPSSFLARLAIANHECNLEQSEIFIVIPVDDSLHEFTGQSLTKEDLNGKFSSNDFERLNLPSGKYAVSTDEYESLKNDHLSFMKFTLLAIIERVNDDWYRGYVTMDSGKRLGKAGLFPANVVQLLPMPEESPKNSLAILLENFVSRSDDETVLNKNECVRILQEKNDWCQVKTATGAIVSCPQSLLRLVDDNETETEPMLDPYGTALFDFRGEHESELSFVAGDVLLLSRWIDAEWLEGENKRTKRTGFIPVGFVQIVLSPPGLEAQTTGDSTQSSVKADDCQPIGIATVLFTFEARYNDELTVEAGTSIKVIATQGEWLKCWNPDTDQVGIVPRDFLRIFSDDDDNVSGNESKTPSMVFTDLTESDVTNQEENVAKEDKPWVSFGCEMSQPVQDHSAEKLLADVLSTETHYIKKTPPARPPPPKMNSQAPIKRSDSTNTVQPLKVASLPVQRTAPSRPKSIAKTSSTSLDEASGDHKDGWETRRANVLEEIITSETIYLFDLSTWEAAVEQNPKLSETKKRCILNGYNMLKYLSRGISASMINEQAKPIIDQEIGLRFMQMKEVFYKTYGRYFRSAEQLTEIIMKGDDYIQKALQESLDQVRQQGSNVFDLSTALSRPIHRCLRYPLYIAEIVKNTPTTHPDHPKLMEALSQMGQLATKMNEVKRRKEMAKKYSKTNMELRESGFLNRLSRLNLKSLAKKSTRFQYRLTSKIGLNSTYRDENCEQLLQTLNDVQQRFCHLIYQLTVYKNRIVRLAKKYVDYNSTLKINNLSSNFEHNSLLKRLNGYASDLEGEVTDLVSIAHDLAKRDFSHIIHKRYDKLADWEMAVRSKKPAEVIEMRRCEFEALNNQLKLILPKEIDKLVDGLNSCVREIKQVDESFFRRVRNWLQKFTTTAPPDFLTFVDPKNQRLTQIENTLRSRQKDVIAVLKSRENPIPDPSLKEMVALKSGSLPPIDPQLLVVCNQQIHCRPQSREERGKLIELCKLLGLHDSLCRVYMKFKSEDEKFVLVEGDIIRRRREFKGLSLVENGLSTCTVPTIVYRKVDYPHRLTVDVKPKTESTGSDWVSVKNIQHFSDNGGEKLQGDKKNEVRFRKEKCKTSSEVLNTCERPDDLPIESVEHASVNWLQYDDKFVDLSSPMAEVHRPAPAPPEARQTWTTFDSDNDTPRVIIRPESIFGNMSNPIPMEPIKLDFSNNEKIEIEEQAMLETPRASQQIHRVAPPPPTQSISPANPFYNELYNLPPPAIPKRMSAKPAMVDPLDMLVTQEIERTRKATSRPLPPAPTGPPPPLPPRHSTMPDAPTSLPIGSVSHSLNGATGQVNGGQSTSDEKDAQNIYVISMFDYDPNENDSVQLKVSQGERLKVLQCCDDANNDEWWLVRNQFGSTGYAPGAYLQRISQ